MGHLVDLGLAADVTFVMWLLYISYLFSAPLLKEPDRALLSALFGISRFSTCRWSIFQFDGGGRNTLNR